MTNDFYNNDLDSVILENLYNLYGITENNTSMNLLYKYLHIRAGIFYNTKKFTTGDLIDFIYQELNIDIYDNHVIIYDNEEYNANIVMGNFLESLDFRAEFEGSINIKDIEKEVYVDGYKLATKFRKSNHYKSYIKYNRLLELNKYFNVNPKAKYDKLFKSHNPYKRTLEEELLSLFDSEKVYSTTTQFIDEKTLEDFLVKNLHLIEEGLVFKGRQIGVSGGILDILAEDKKGRTVIIELKVENDKSIIWQALHYQKVVKEEQLIEKDIRMITLAPYYKESILMRLKEINNVETLEYNIKVSLGEIEELTIKKV